MRLFIIGIGILALNLFDFVYAKSNVQSNLVSKCDEQPLNRPFRIMARHIEPGGIGYHQGYTTLEGFFSLYNGWNHWLPFLDARCHIFNDGRPSVNAGLGLRYLKNHRIWGFNSYYDYRKTKRQHYNQVAIGLESLGSLWDVRLNGYLPVGKKQSSYYDMHFDQFRGHNALIYQKYEYAFAGFNAEGAIHLNHWKNVPLYFAAGPYYLNGKGDSAWGGQLRARANVFECFQVDANVSYDHLFKWIGQGQIGLSFSFGSRKKIQKEQQESCDISRLLSDRLCQSVDRFEIIPVDKSHRISKAINPSTGFPYQFIFVDNTSSSLGTYESPYHSLASVEAYSGPGDIIYVYPGDGTTRYMDHGIVLKPNQKLWSTSLTYTLPTTLGSISLPQMSLSSPKITNIDLLGDATTLSTQNEVCGITYMRSGGQAIYGLDPISASISSCIFNDCGLDDLGIFPMLFEASSPLAVILEGNQFFNNPNAGVYVRLFSGVSSAEITMNNTQAENNQTASGGGSILTIEGHGSIGNCLLVMNNNHIQNNDCGAVNITDFDSPNDGSFALFQGVFSQNIFENNHQGITFSTNADTCNISIRDNYLSGNESGGILVRHGSGGAQLIKETTIVIDSNQINNSGNSGDAVTISPSGDHISINLTNNIITNNQGSGFVSYFAAPQPIADLVISNNEIANNLNFQANASGGISFDEFKSVNARIESNILSNNINGNSIGRYESITPNTSTVQLLNNQFLEGDTFEFDFSGLAPEFGCLTVTGNTSALDPTYSYYKLGTGSCFIVPCTYASENTGGFDLFEITPATDCSGEACP